jgi:small subunit ribosomal protein S20
VANLFSAKKRIKQNETRRARNRARKSLVKSSIRKFEEALKEGDTQLARDLLRQVTKRLDQTGAKGTLHKNTVARRKSRLARRLNTAVATKAG